MGGSDGGADAHRMGWNMGKEVADTIGRRTERFNGTGLSSLKALSGDQHRGLAKGSFHS